MIISCGWLGVSIFAHVMNFLTPAEKPLPPSRPGRAATDIPSLVPGQLPKRGGEHKFYPIQWFHDNII